jgi:hypothetical protein
LAKQRLRRLSRAIASALREPNRRAKTPASALQLSVALLLSVGRRYEAGNERELASGRLKFE